MKEPIIIDVREPEEYARSHVKGALNIPPSELMSGPDKLKNISKDARIILYCISGSRSNMSKSILEGMGYKNVENGINQQQVEAKLRA
ncbi:rhodanese-like domain-containing protein [Candidatus Saccharibacteria bacterium]|nr:rhodanese-like domain-containing protein [Candidatus Saccharibacteria bacterium]